MSELSEQVEAALRTTADNHKPDDEKSGLTVITDETIGDLPQVDSMRSYYGDVTSTIINRIYRHHSGSSPFEKPSEAFERTREEVVGALTALLITTLSDGIQMGQEKSFPYKKYRYLHKLNEVFGADAWKEESALIAMPFMDDSDCVKVISSYVTQVCGHLGAVTGYVGASGKMLNKIWDLWALTGQSGIVTFYSAGVALGRSWVEKDTLAGILLASEETSDD